MTDIFETAIVVAIIALCGVLITALVAYTASRRAAYISSVTAERSKWIDKLRGNIADLLGVCSAISMEENVRYSPNHQQADRLIALITLQLNPNDESGIDRNLLVHMKRLVDSAQGRGSPFRTEEKRFVRHCQFLLKEEWEKVKSEAKGAVMARLTGSQKGIESRNKKYREFYFAELNPPSKDK